MTETSAPERIWFYKVDGSITVERVTAEAVEYIRHDVALREGYARAAEVLEELAAEREQSAQRPNDTVSVDLLTQAGALLFASQTLKARVLRERTQAERGGTT